MTTKRDGRNRRSSRKSTPNRPLNVREIRFVEQYLIDLNATQAAIRAGYSPKSARQMGARLCTKASISAALRKGMEARSERTGITADRVLKELESLAFSDVSHYLLDPKGGKVTLAAEAPPTAIRAVSSIKHKVIPFGEGDFIHEIELKLWDKVATLTLAGRHVDVHGFASRVEVTGKNGKALFQDPKTLTDAELEALWQARIGAEASEKA